jgi:hypothetical protein
MTTNTHHIASLLPILAILVAGIFRWSRWRDAKTRGMSQSQFATAEAGSADKLLMRAQRLRALGWGLIAFPFICAALSLINHRDTLFVLIGGTVILELVTGGLGWIFLWQAKQTRELARQMGTLR